MTGCQTGASVPVDKGIWLDWKRVHIEEMHFHYSNQVDLGGISGNKIDQKQDNTGKLEVPLVP
jgi:hypothetical protein